MYSYWYCYFLFKYVSIYVITVFVIWIRVFVCPPIAMLPRARLTRLAADADATILSSLLMLMLMQPSGINEETFIRGVSFCS